MVGGSIPSKMFYAFDLDKEELAWDMKMDLGVRCMAIETNPDGSTKRIFTQLSALNGFSRSLLESKSPELLLTPMRSELNVLVHAYLRTCIR